MKKKRNEVHELLGAYRSCKGDAGPELGQVVSKLDKNLPQLRKGKTPEVRARGIVNLKVQLLLMLPKDPALYTPKHFKILTIIENAENTLFNG